MQPEEGRTLSCNCSLWSETVILINCVDSFFVILVTFYVKRSGLPHIKLYYGDDKNNQNMLVINNM